MSEGCIKKTTEYISLTELEFRKYELFQETEKKSKEIAEAIQQLDLVKEFKDVSTYSRHTYKDQSFQGPTGHQFLINDDEFGSSFDNYLQFFEFTLIAQSTLNTMKKFQGQCDLIIHAHDGNAIAVKKDIEHEFINHLNKEVLQTGKKLGLKFD